MTAGSRRAQGSSPPLTSADIPQRPTNLEIIARLIVKLVSIKEEWETYTSNEQRAARYVCQAAQILGLVTAPTVTQARTTPTGRVFAAMGPLEQKRRLSFAFENSRVGRAWLDWAHVGDLRQLRSNDAHQFLSECASGLSDAPKGTLRERAATLSRWLEQFKNARNQIDLEDHRHRRPVRQAAHLTPAVFDSGISQHIVNALVQGSSRIDISTGFFTLDGYHLLADGLDNPDMRILVGGIQDHGWSATHATFLVRFVQSLDRGLEPPHGTKKHVIQAIYWAIINGRISLRSLAARESKQLHAKVYIFDDRAVYVTSANLTKSGLCYHIECGQIVTRKEDIDYYSNRFEQHWDEAAPLAEALLQKIEESWVFEEPVRPYIAFLRALFLLYGRLKEPERIPARQLAEFQKLLVSHIIGHFAERRGLMLVSPTGTGKTVMAAYVAAALRGSQVRRVLVVCNNESLERYWRQELQMVGIDPGTITSGKLRGKSPNPEPGLEDIAHLRQHLHEDTLVIVDECHQYRNPRSNGYRRLRALLLPDDELLRPYALLLTATPISRGVENLETLLGLTTYEKIAPLPSVAATADAEGMTNVTLPDILRRFGIDDARHKTRALQFAEDRRYYPNIDLELHTYASPMKAIFRELNELAEALKAFGAEIAERLAEDDEDEEITGNLGRQANLLKTVLSRRAESSPRALVRTLERILDFIEDRALSPSEKEELRSRVTPLLDKAHTIERSPGEDKKLTDLLKLLSGQSTRRGILIFSEYVDTAEYLREHIGKRFPRSKVELLTGISGKATRRRKMRSFAPIAQGATSTDASTDILIGTDAISEGENLQDAKIVINYDLPWTPLRLVQRLGRIDRPTLHHRAVSAFNYFPKSQVYRSMISHWTRLNARSADVRTLSDAEVLQSSTRNPDLFRGKPNTLYFEHVSTYDELLELTKDQQPPTSTFLRVQLSASPEDRRIAEELPSGIRTSRAGDRPGLYLLLESQGRFVSIAHHHGEIFIRNIDRLEFLRALSCGPETPCDCIPEDLDARIEAALGQWAEGQSPEVRETVLIQIALWVGRKAGS